MPSNTDASTAKTTRDRGPVRPVYLPCGSLAELPAVLDRTRPAR